MKAPKYTRKNQLLILGSGLLLGLVAGIGLGANPFSIEILFILGLGTFFSAIITTGIIFLAIRDMKRLPPENGETP